MTRMKLIASGEGAPASKQLTKACSDCPLRRDALPGWLGGSTPDEYKRLCHSDAVVECHVHSGSRCAGLTPDQIVQLNRDLARAIGWSDADPEDPDVVTVSDGIFGAPTNPEVEPEVLRMEQTPTTSASASETPRTAVIVGAGRGRVMGLLTVLAAMQAATAFAVAPEVAEAFDTMDFTKDPFPEPKSYSPYDTGGKRKAQWKNERNGRRFKR